ncbi:MAG: hypothetical protein WCL44_16205, partial [bacterium]
IVISRIGARSITGSATLEMTGVDAVSNDGTGIYVNAGAAAWESGVAICSLNQVSAMSNSADGVRFANVAASGADSAVFQLMNSDAQGNGLNFGWGNGFSFGDHAASSGGSATAIFSSDVSVNNDDYGYYFGSAVEDEGGSLTGPSVWINVTGSVNP